MVQKGRICPRRPWGKATEGEFGSHANLTAGSRAPAYKFYVCKTARSVRFPEKFKDKTMKKCENFVYFLDGKPYINLTNRCSNACTFCVRNGKDSYFGNELWLSREPSEEEILAGLGDPKQYPEVVFCGFGEPTYRLDTLVAVGSEIRKRGGRVRLNTNGQADLINGYPTAPKLKTAVDFINVSLNEASAEKYQAVCRSAFGEKAYDALIAFAVSCKNEGIETCFSVVDCIGKEDVDRCREIADRAGIPLRVRKFIPPEES